MPDKIQLEKFHVKIGSPDLDQDWQWEGDVEAMDPQVALLIAGVRAAGDGVTIGSDSVVGIWESR
jgi:hypothetical protein